MSWDWIALCVKAGLGFALVGRLLVLHFQGVYRAFCIFVLYESVGSSLFFVQHYFCAWPVNYNLEWLSLTAAGWVVNLWLVYAVLEAVLARLPGILRFSRRLLNYTFIGSVAVALITARLELSARVSPAGQTFLDAAVSAGETLERVIATVVLLVMLAILGFVLWFPVSVPRNLVVFSLGLVCFFTCRNILMLAEEFLSTDAGRREAATASMVVLAGCFIYWSVSLTKAGESIQVNLGHRWRHGDQEKLVGQLEAMNASLLRAARR